MTVSKNRMLEVLLTTIQKIRFEKGIVPTPGFKMEGSCFAARGGEFGNLFWQLVYTTLGTGEWLALNDPTIMKGVINYLQEIGR